MNTIVYGKIERAKRKIDELLADMRYGDILSVNKSISEYSFTLKNGDRFYALRADQNARGHKWDMAYIDTSIEQNILRNIVYPSRNPYEKRKIEDRITFY